MSTLKDKLRLWRKADRIGRGEITQVNAALRLGVPLKTLQAWESGRYAPRGITLRAIEQIINQERQ